MRVTIDSMKNYLREEIIMKKKLGLFICCLLMATSLCGETVRVFANNYKDTTFSIEYYADGSDYPIEPREKQDNTASYIKSYASNPALLVCVAGTNNANSYTAIDPNRCSSIISVPSGSYRYISNTVYGNYSYAYLVIGTEQTNQTYTISGKWSPDNISNRY